jgi:hypothetical protein
VDPKWKAEAVSDLCSSGSVGWLLSLVPEELRSTKPRSTRSFLRTITPGANYQSNPLPGLWEKSKLTKWSLSLGQDAYSVKFISLQVSYHYELLCSAPLKRHFQHMHIHFHGTSDMSHIGFWFPRTISLGSSRKRSGNS